MIEVLILLVTELTPGCDDDCLVDRNNTADAVMTSRNPSPVFTMDSPGVPVRRAGTPSPQPNDRSTIAIGRALKLMNVQCPLSFYVAPSSSYSLQVAFRFDATALDAQTLALAWGLGDASTAFRHVCETIRVVPLVTLAQQPAFDEVSKALAAQNSPSFNASGSSMRLKSPATPTHDHTPGSVSFLLPDEALTLGRDNITLTDTLNTAAESYSAKPVFDALQPGPLALASAAPSIPGVDASSPAGPLSFAGAPITRATSEDGSALVLSTPKGLQVTLNLQHTIGYPDSSSECREKAYVIFTLVADGHTPFRHAVLGHVVCRVCVVRPLRVSVSDRIVTLPQLGRLLEPTSTIRILNLRCSSKLDEEVNVKSVRIEILTVRRGDETAFRSLRPRQYPVDGTVSIDKPQLELVAEPVPAHASCPLVLHPGEEVHFMFHLTPYEVLLTDDGLFTSQCVKPRTLDNSPVSVLAAVTYTRRDVPDEDLVQTVVVAWIYRSQG
jgi:hypothetical protein